MAVAISVAVASMSRFLASWSKMAPRINRHSLLFELLSAFFISFETRPLADVFSRLTEWPNGNQSPSQAFR